MADYDPTIPQANDLISNSQPQILNNFAQLNTIFGQDHYTWNDGTNGGADRGMHKQVDLPIVRGADPVLSASNTGMFYTKTVSGAATPFFAGWNGATTVITPLGGQGSNPIFVPGIRGYVIFPGGLIQQWGQVAAYNSGNIAISFLTGGGINFPSACFNVIVTVVAGNTDISLAISNITANGFNLRALAFAGGPVSVNWFAIGN